MELAKRLRGRGVRVFDQRHDRGQPRVELRREHPGVFGAHLDQLVLDRAERPGKRPRRVLDRRGVEPRRPRFGLRPEVAQHHDRVVDAVEQIVRSPRPGVLLAQVVVRRWHARVAHDRERLHQGAAAGRETDLIGTRWHPGGHERVGRAAPALVVRELRGVGAAQVPHEPVGARVARRPRLLVASGGSRRAARERSDGAPVGVEERERELARRVLQPVVDDHAVRRVLAGVEQTLLLLAGRRLDLPVRIAHRADHAVRDLTARPRLVAVTAIRPPADRRPRGEQMRVGARDRAGHLVERREVVEDPERAAVGRDHQIGVLHDQVVDRRDRQVARQPLPRAAVVERHPDLRLGAAVEQPAAVRILADHPGELAIRQAVGDALPRASVVARLEQIRARVIELVASGGDVAGGRVVRRRLEDADQRPFGQVRRRHRLPCPAAVAREMDEAVVGARPEHVALVG